MLKKGDKSTIRAWAMYDWANSAYALVITSAVFPFFYEGVTSRKDELGNVVEDFVFDRYGIRNTALYSYSISVGFLIVALIAPLLSGIADYSDSKKKFLQFFCYLGSFACMGLYFFELNTLWLGLTFVSVACIGFSGSLIFYNAFLPEIAEEKDHDRVSALGFALGYIGSVLLLIFNLFMVMSPETFGLTDGGQGAKISFVLVGLWWAGFAQITFRKLPKSVFGTKVTNQIMANGYREIRKVMKELSQTSRLKRFLIAFFIYNTGVQTVMYMAANFAAKEIKKVDEFGNESAMESSNLIITIMLIQLVAIAGAFLFSYTSSRIGNIRTLIFAVFIWICICVGAYFVQYEEMFYVLASIVGLVMGGVQALSRSTYSKFLPETKDHASYFSFYNICYYVGTVLGTFIFGLAFQLTGTLRSSIVAIGSFFVIGIVLLLLVPRTETYNIQSSNSN